MYSSFRLIPLFHAVTIAGAGILFSSDSAAVDPTDQWRVRNAVVVKQNQLKTRERDVPETDVKLDLQPGQVYPLKNLPEIQLAHGVSATVAWGKGALLEVLTMEPNADYPEQQLNEELFMVIRQGSADCEIDGHTISLSRDHVLYLTPGQKRRLVAGSDGLQAFEIFSPVRADHLALAGVRLAEGADVGFPDQGVSKTSLEPGKAYNLNEIQWTAITRPDTRLPYPRSSAQSRLIWGRNTMLSFVRMDPDSSFPLHIHPEDQLMLTLRGKLVEGIMDFAYPMEGQHHDVVLQPGGMAHSAQLSEFGAEALDVFWPVRPDYLSYSQAQTELYEQVITPGTQPVKLAEGFTFSEGPTWLDGSLYFSDMYFRDHRNGDWTGSPQKSRLIRLEPDGTTKVLSTGMQTNGTIASRDGNLLVCDMFGHRVIEMDPDSGKVLGTALDHVDGRPIDGPNDLVMDAKGGFYVSDPQFTPQEKKSQPGKQVYYVNCDGTAKVVIPPGEYAMPNGVEISPDGKTFYVNNTWFNPGANFVWAYDVHEDGTLSNKRKFAELNLTPDVLSAQNPEMRVDSRADGMAVDMDGRLYVCTLSGIQVFEDTGVYVGTIWFPQYPVSCTFGGRNYDQLYAVGESSAWVIQTKVKGFRVP
ncbi:MAG: SMP-30/gluconolactonase/LRE family protein [Fuerstiella sp.]|nr:SMP-30/gluconolactonase/LRE family protein [Fuerstiella sp.]